MTVDRISIFPVLTEDQLNEMEVNSFQRAEEFNIDPNQISKKDLPRRDFLGRPLDPRRALAIAIEAEISSQIGRLRPQFPTYLQKVEDHTFEIDDEY